MGIKQRRQDYPTGFPSMHIHSFYGKMANSTKLAALIASCGDGGALSDADLLLADANRFGTGTGIINKVNSSAEMMGGFHLR